MKSEILHILRNRDGYVSGQELCEKFGVSRTAVWKVIQKLKEEGYEIEAIPKIGYRILAFPDMVCKVEIESQLETKWAGREISYYPVLDSTNNQAKRLAEDGAVHGTLVVAEEQTDGRGRRGKLWTTPAGTSVAMTLIIRPQLALESASMVTLIMGMAVSSACQELSGMAAQIKWPNDVVMDGKKICGILTEVSAELQGIHYLVIGAGINVNMDEIPEELQEAATSLSIQTGHTMNRAEVIGCCMKYFEKYYETFLEAGDMSELKEDYDRMLVNKDRTVRVLDPLGAYDGIAKGINEKGELLVERQDGSVEAVYAGEVSVRGVYGYV